jgi:hypothetical protein
MKRTCFACLLFLFSNNIFAGSSTGPAQNVPSIFTPGPDIVAGNMDDLEQFGSVGTTRGLATGLTSCNHGDQLIGYFAIPGTDHPVVAQNLYRMSGGSGNNDRFEQIGQSWVKHTFGAKQADDCNYGCQPGGDFSHLGVGCTDTYLSSQSADQSLLGSRAWINPYTGVFPSNARDHTGHVHTAVSHMMIVESADLNPASNPGATYYAELVYATPDEFTWCQAHPGQCNMSNNASYLQYSVSGTTNFTFFQVGDPEREKAAITAWAGATIQMIEPDPGNDGRAFVAYKVTGPVGGVYHYEYAIYNLNLDRGIQSFSVPRLLVPSAGDSADGIGPEENVGFHGPPQQPGFPNDGTQNNAGYSSAPWTFTSGAQSLTWNSETFAQNQNANAIRWGTLYNFRFDSTTAPTTSNATIGFFKTGAPITVQVMGPQPIGGPVHMMSGTVVYCSNPSLNPVPGATLTLTGSTSGTTQSDGSGNYAFFPLMNGGSYTVTPAKAGLAPGSNGLNTVDVLAISRHFLGIALLTGCRLTAADVNADTNVNTLDVIAVQRFFLTYTTGIANVGKYQFNPASRSYPNLTSDQTNQNYDTLIFGDVTAPFVSP